MQQPVNHPNPNAKLDVIGIGNAIVDVLSFCEDALLTRLKLAKGGMMLIDELTAERLYQDMGTGTECSGGSVANTLAGIASLGGACAFTGKVRNDQLGGIFRHDMRAVGVAFDTPEATSGPATARCLIFVTPDAQRTMNTYLGACTQVAEADVDEALIARAKILYVEGYLWDQPEAKAAIRKAFRAAKAAGVQVAFTLSDTFCVERHRAEFLELLNGSVDILFANEQEACALFETTDIHAAAEQLRSRVRVAAITRGEHGCLAIAGNATEEVHVQKIAEVVDTTGAGDLFASGFLFAHARGQDLRASATLGNACAGVIIQQLGARSQTPLKQLAA